MSGACTKRRCRRWGASSVLRRAECTRGLWKVVLLASVYVWVLVCDAMRVDQNTHGKYSHNHGFTYSAKQYFKFRPFFSSSSFSCLKVIAMRCDLFDFFRQVYLQTSFAHTKGMIVFISVSHTSTQLDFVQDKKNTTTKNRPNDYWLPLCCSPGFDDIIIYIIRPFPAFVLRVFFPLCAYAERASWSVEGTRSSSHKSVQSRKYRNGNLITKLLFCPYPESRSARASPLGLGKWFFDHLAFYARWCFYFLHVSR